MAKKSRQQSTRSPLAAKGIVSTVSSAASVEIDQPENQLPQGSRSDLSDSTTNREAEDLCCLVGNRIEQTLAFVENELTQDQEAESPDEADTVTAGNLVSTARVEVLLSELHDRLAHTFRTELSAALDGRRFAEEMVTSSQSEPDLPLCEINTARPDVQVVPATTSPRTWAEIRQAMLSDSEKSDVTASTSQPPARPTESYSAAAAIPSRSATRLPPATLEVECPIEIPEFGDPMTMNAAELRETLFSREKLLCKVIGQLRRHSQHPTVTLTTEQLRVLAAELPAELAGRVNQTLQQLDEQLRLGELELSLERARVGRQAAQNEISRQLLDRGARQLGWTLKPDGSLSTNGHVASKPSQTRRWLGKLGFGD